ncbi:GNAT family N-acetyltransferase [Phytohabitans rumicis]|uniref:GNAT family N-acetyltransferase n=1 Tax=Phytohabitans rumicis TaxID=1076125 RepID=UPI0024835967|nr:GNAT family N-acetyltransferase [Phytohabitans rumicis]
MSQPLIDIVRVSDHLEGSRWQAVSPGGSVAGVATLRTITPFGHALLLPPAPATTPGAPEVSLYVEPQWRRRGIGSRLLATVREQTAEPRLVADVAEGTPGEAFCQRHGFRHTRSRRHDLLTYCDVHRAWLGELVDAEHPGYRLTHWTGDLPNAPRVEELLRSPSRPGNAVLTAADANGDLAAYAVAVVGALFEPRARQYGPAVLPDHRGQQLGRWVNAALIQRLREVHPHVNEIETAAAEDDPHLLAVREHLGFRFLRRTHLYELALP